jgi:hypothetical protein
MRNERPITAVSIDACSLGGWWGLTAEGQVGVKGAAVHYGAGDLTGTRIADYFTAIRSIPAGNGYYLVLGGGGVQAKGSAVGYGGGTPSTFFRDGLCWDLMIEEEVGETGYALQHQNGLLEAFGDFEFLGAIGGYSSPYLRSWAIATVAGAETSPIRSELITVSDEVMAFLRKTGSKAALNGVLSRFGDPTEPTIKGSV